MKLWGKEQRSECLGDDSPCWVCWNSWLGSLQTPPCLLKVVRIIIGRKRISLLCLHFKGKWPLSPARTPKIFSSLHGLAFWLAGCCCVSIPGAGLSGGSQRPKAFVQLLSCFTFPDRENGCGLACMPGEEAQNDRAPWLPGKLGAHDSIQPANTGLALFMFFFLLEVKWTNLKYILRWCSVHLLFYVIVTLPGSRTLSSCPKGDCVPTEVVTSIGCCA